MRRSSNLEPFGAAPPQMERAREIRRRRFQIPGLPEEVVAEILSRLPVKSLLRFRCVSKFWRSLIDSKHFVRLHLEKSGKHPSFARHRIIAHSHKPFDGLNPTLRHFPLPSLLNEPITHVSDFDDPLCASNAMLLVVGSCDGLICVLSSTNKFFLWNPSTRIFRQLPCVDDELNGWYVSEFGFGLDESNGDYKVFCIVMSYGDRFAAEGKVYSLQTNSWSRIECVDGHLVSRVGQFLSGKLHWLWTSGEDSRVDIVSFDLKKQVYGKIQLPCRADSHYELSLGKVEECLYVFCGHQRSRLDVWVMKQYGVQGSWTKVMTLPYVTDSWERSFSMPLFMGQNGEILLSDWPNFLIYSPKDKRAWNPRMNSPDEIVDAHVYIESLVSPVSSAEQ